MQIKFRGKPLEIGPHPIGTRLKLQDACPAIGAPDIYVVVVRPNPAKGEYNGPTPEYSAIRFDDSHGGRAVVHTANLLAVA